AHAPLASSLYAHLRYVPSFPTRRSSDLRTALVRSAVTAVATRSRADAARLTDPTSRRPTRRPKRRERPSLRNPPATFATAPSTRSEEHTSELQSLRHLVCRLLLEKKKKN